MVLNEFIFIVVPDGIQIFWPTTSLRSLLIVVNILKSKKNCYGWDMHYEVFVKNYLGLNNVCIIFIMHKEFRQYCYGKVITPKIRNFLSRNTNSVTAW